MPLAIHSFGYIEMGVKPGMVLISLSRKPRPPSSKKKSTRDRPSQRNAVKDWSASACTSAVCAGVSGAGTSACEPSSTYLSA
jgi:hypothetical protein